MVEHFHEVTLARGLGDDHHTGVVLGGGRVLLQDRLDADLVVSCIGYRSVPLEGAPFDERAGRFANDEGLIAPQRRGTT